MAVISAGKTVATDALKKKRLQLQKEKKAKRAFINLILQIVFAALMYTISYLSRDQRAYLLKANIENQLYQSSKYQSGFAKVSSKESFITWINDTLLPVYFPTSSYNGGSISVLDKFFIGDLTNLRVGLIRMRQLRVKKESCFGPSVLHGHFCARKYDSDSENKNTFCDDCSKVWSSEAWHYVSAKEIWGTDLFGTYNSYGGGGFINKLENDKLITEKIIGESVINRWIDRLTRAVLVEFTLYNANINMLAYSIFMAEFPETGGAFTWFDTQCFRPTVLTDSTGLFSIICYIILVLIIIVITIKLIKTIKKENLKAIKNLWNIVDIILCVFTYVAIVVWILKFINTKRALSIYYNDKSKFVNFQHIIIWEYMFNCILGILCFACTIRLLRALGYNQRLTEIATVLRIGGNEIFKFFVLFFFAFSGFTVLGYLLFGPNVFEWRNLFVSFGSLTNTLIGRNSLDKLIRASPNFAECYFFIYVFFMLFTMMTIFLAILNQAIEKARAHPDYNAQTIGISNIIKGTLNDVLQMFGIHIGRKKRKVKETNMQSKRKPAVNTANVMHLVRETFTEMIQDHHDEAQIPTPRKDKPMRHVTFKTNEQPWAMFKIKKPTGHNGKDTFDNKSKASADFSAMSAFNGNDDKHIDRITPSNISLEVANMTDPRKQDDYYEVYKPYL